MNTMASLLVAIAEWDNTPNPEHRIENRIWFWRARGHRPSYVVVGPEMALAIEFRALMRGMGAPSRLPSRRPGAFIGSIEGVSVYLSDQPNAPDVRICFGERKPGAQASGRQRRNHE